MFDIVKPQNREIEQESGVQFGDSAKIRLWRLIISKTRLILLTISEDLS